MVCQAKGEPTMNHSFTAGILAESHRRDLVRDAEGSARLRFARLAADEPEPARRRRAAEALARVRRVVTTLVPALPGATRLVGPRLHVRKIS